MGDRKHPKRLYDLGAKWILSAARAPSQVAGMFLATRERDERRAIEDRQFLEEWSAPMVIAAKLLKWLESAYGSGR